MSIPRIERLALIRKGSMAAVDAIDVLAVVGVDHAALGPIGDEVAGDVGHAARRPMMRTLLIMCRWRERGNSECASFFGQPHHALAQAHIVVGDVEQRGRGIGLVGLAGRRHLVGRALGEQGEPLLDPPVVEQVGLEIEEVFDPRAQPGAVASRLIGLASPFMPHRRRSCRPPSTRSRHCRQKQRICSSSSFMGGPLRGMPLEMSFQPTSRRFL